MDYIYKHLIITAVNTKGGDNDGESDSSSDGDLVVSWKGDKARQEEEEEEELEITAEKLAELDAQTNPFNFSERVSQTAWNKLKVSRQE